MEEKRKSFGFQGFEMKRSGIAPLGLQKRTSLEPPAKTAKKIRPISPPRDGKSSLDTFTPDLSTPPPRQAMYSRRSTGSSYTPPFPSPLGRTNADGSTPSPRLLFKTKVYTPFHEFKESTKLTLKNLLKETVSVILTLI